MSRSALWALGLAFVTLGAAQVAVEGESMGPWWTVVGLAHIAFGIVMNHRGTGLTVGDELPTEEDG